MRHRSQKVRLGFLIVLTIMVLTFGVTNLLRTYHRGQERTSIALTEQQVLPYAEEALQAEHAQLVRFARDERGRTARDAAALLAQVRRLEALSALPSAQRADMDLAAAFNQVQQNLARIEAGRPAVFPHGQPFLRACYSPVDGALLPYGIQVPKEYADSYSYPLIITLGEQTDETLPYQSTPAYGGAVSVLANPGPPGGYGSIGVEELVAVLRDVALTYNVDPRRVYLVGRQRGADAAYQAAVSIPELFAGVALFQITRSCPDEPPGPPPVSSQPPALGQMLDFVPQALCPGSYARNLTHLRVVLMQNAGGGRSALRSARALAERLRGVGADLEYLEFPLAPGAPFPDWTQQYAIAAVMSRAGTLRPAEFSFQTASIRSRHAWWAQLDALGDDPARFCTVTGRLAGAVAQITTDNVAALSIIPDRLPEGATSVLLDGAAFDLPKAPMALSRQGGEWLPGDPKGPYKHEELSGPFSDVLRDRFLIVYGSQGDDDLLKLLSYSEAREMAEGLKARFGLDAPLKADSEVTDGDVARMNLVLIGGPAVNSISALVAGPLPVKLQGGRALVGQDAFTGQDLGLLLCYPNPAKPDRMVALVDGATPAALYQALRRFSWASSDGYRWFDYAVFDDRTAGPESCLALGIFGSRWQLPSASAGAAWTARPEDRRGLLPQHFPALRSAADSEEAAVYLSDVRPKAVDQPYGAVAFDRAYDGRAIRLGDASFARGIGTGAPSTVTFTLGGPFSTFKAVPVLTSQPTDSAPAVIFEVLGDGEVLATAPPAAPVKDGTPAAITADISGVTTLALRVRLAAGSGDGLQCAWADAAVSR